MYKWYSSLSSPSLFSASSVWLAALAICALSISRSFMSCSILASFSFSVILSRSGAAMLCCAFFILAASTLEEPTADDVTDTSDRSERCLKVQGSFHVWREQCASSLSSELNKDARFASNIVPYLHSLPGVRLERSRIILFLGDLVTLWSGAKRPCFAGHSKYLFSPTMPSFLPNGPSSSTPAHSPAAKSVGPMKRRVPVLVPVVALATITRSPNFSGPPAFEACRY